jgi:hypothetical protein
MSTNKLIIRSLVKVFALAVAQTRHPNRFNRVSGEFLLRVEGQVKVFIRSYIHQVVALGTVVAKRLFPNQGSAPKLSP